MGTVITPRARRQTDGTIVWQVPFRSKDAAGRTKQTSETFPDVQTAQRFAKLIADVGVTAALDTLAAWEGVDAPTLRLADWARQHVAGMSGVQDAYRRRMLRVIEHDLGEMGAMPLEAVSDKAVRAWVNEMAAAGLSGKTIKNKHGFLSSVMEHAVRSKDTAVTTNPCKGTRLPRTETAPMVFLTHEEYAVFLDYITPFWQPLVTTLFSTGLRWGEATALQVRDLDLEAGSLTVSRAWKDGGELGPPKSKKSRRTIALAPETVDVLRDVVRGRSGEQWVFTNQRGNAVRGATFHENVWQPAVRLANGEPAALGKRVARRVDANGRVIEPAKVPLGKRPRVHDARHTCASWLLGSGVPINYVQAHLGHESITTTVDRYGHVMPAARQAIAGALSFALGQAHPQLEG